MRKHLSFFDASRVLKAGDIVYADCLIGIPQGTQMVVAENNLNEMHDDLILAYGDGGIFTVCGPDPADDSPEDPSSPWQEGCGLQVELSLGGMSDDTRITVDGEPAGELAEFIDANAFDQAELTALVADLSAGAPHHYAIGGGGFVTIDKEA